MTQPLFTDEQYAGIGLQTLPVICDPGPDQIRNDLGWHTSPLTDFVLKLVVTGKPVVLKNGKSPFPMGARVSHGRAARWIIAHAKPVKPWLKEAEKQLRAQWIWDQPIPLEIELNAAIVTYRGDKRRADSSNLYQAPEDALCGTLRPLMAVIALRAWGRSGGLVG